MSVDGDPLIGDEGELQYDSASSYATPTWVKQTELSDLAIDTSPITVEVPKRTRHKVAKGGREEWSLSFSLNVAPGDTFYDAVQTAIRTNAPIHLAVSEGDITASGTNYDHAWWFLRGGKTFNLDGVAVQEIEGMPHADAPAGEPPAEATVSP